ncbi:hypothetical protein KEM52_005685 [Ascosphaera acerosa]|nr:hypothetical protein KEM52_005685 [Ascosphaera acerosa]
MAFKVQHLCDQRRESVEMDKPSKADPLSGIHHPILPNPPSIEAAYRQKCITLKRRLQQVEATNEDLRLRNLRGRRYIEKMRLESCILLERLSVLMGMKEDATQHAFGGPGAPAPAGLSAAAGPDGAATDAQPAQLSQRAEDMSDAAEDVTPSAQPTPPTVPVPAHLRSQPNPQDQQQDQQQDHQQQQQQHQQPPAPDEVMGNGDHTAYDTADGQSAAVSLPRSPSRRLSDGIVVAEAAATEADEPMHSTARP